MALIPGNPVVGGTVLRRAAIQSPDFADGSTGWQISQDGSAEFNNLEIRGTFEGTGFIITANGIFFYSGTPAAGNLVISVTDGSATTDPEGNKLLVGAGMTIYGTSTAIFYSGLGQAIFTGSLSVGWTFAGGEFTIHSGGGGYDIGSTLSVSGALTATGGTAASPTLITTDTWHPMTLAAGWSTAGGQPVPSYRLLPDGNVQVTGVATHAGFAAATALVSAALPAAYRPATEQFVAGGIPGDASIAIATSGLVNAEPGTLTCTVVRFNGTYPTGL